MAEKSHRSVVDDIADMTDEQRGDRGNILDALKWLHKEGHPALAQYVATVVTPAGLTLREAAAAMGVSHQRVAQLRDRGLRNLSDPAKLHHDLSYWPVLPPDAQPTRPIRRKKVSRNALWRLRTLNEEAKAYRVGLDPEPTLRFYRAVKALHDVGLSYNAMADALGENPIVFRRRLQRWGITESHKPRVNLTQLAMLQEERLRLAEKAI